MKQLSFSIRTKENPSPHEISAILKEDLSDRLGYDENFLNESLKIPKAVGSLSGRLATVTQGPKRHGEHILDYTHFSVAFDKVNRLPAFCIVNVDGKTNIFGAVHEARESDKWFADERLKTAEGNHQLGDQDYYKSGLQKGHMVRYFDPGWGTATETKIAMGDTFHYTNCCPQIPYFNIVSWNYLEDYCMARSIFLNFKTTVISGPILTKIAYFVSLPTPYNFWKILVYNKMEGGIGAVGFIMSQQDLIEKKQSQDQLLLEKTVEPTLKKSDIERLFKEKKLFSLVVSIALIEEKTGLKFGLEQVDDHKTFERYQNELVLPKSSYHKLTELYESMNMDYTPFLQNL